MSTIQRVQFLTPYKIAILLICMRYCEGKIYSENRIDLMTDVLYFIDGTVVDPESTGIELLDTDLEDLKKITGSYKLIDGTPLYDNLIHVFVNDLRSIDGLHEFFCSINKYLQQPLTEISSDEYQFETIIKVTNESALGAFFRKCYLEFDRLSFDEVSLLWDAFRSFTEPLNADSSMESQDLGLLSQLAEKPTKIQLIAEENLEALLDYQNRQIQNRSYSLPKNIQNLLETLIQNYHQGLSSSLPPSIYYVKYLDACRNRDLEQALENLHHFYDLSLSQNKNAHYQQALFTLAILHSEFNNHEQAIKAAEESIAVARQKNDHHFLTRILSWLYSYLDKCPEYRHYSSLPSTDQMGQFLKTKSWQTSGTLYSLAHRTDAIRSMRLGIKPLSNIFENILKGFSISVNSGSPILRTSYYSCKSQLWERCGISSIAKLYSSLGTLSDDSNKSIINGLSVRLTRAHQLFEEGHIDTACNSLLELQPLTENNIGYRQIWFPHMLLTLVRRYLNEQKLVAAETLLDRLDSLNDDLDTDFKFEIELQRLKLNMALGNYELVAPTAGKAAEQVAKARSDIIYNMHFMMIYIRAVLRTDHPERALSMVIQTYLVAERAALVTVCCELMILLAQLLCSTGEFKDSMRILDEIMPKVLESECVRLIGEAYETLADASVGLAETSSNKNDLLDKAYVYLSISGANYQKYMAVAKNLEVCSKMLVLSKLTGNETRQKRMELAVQEYHKMMKENRKWGYNGVV